MQYARFFFVSFYFFLLATIGLPVMHAQVVSSAQITETLDLTAVKASLKAYEIATVNPLEIKAALHTQGRFTLNLPSGQSLKGQLESVQQISPSYSLRTEGDNGTTARQGFQLSTYQGAKVNGQGVSLTIGTTWLQGQLPQGDGLWYVEPASRLVPNAPTNSYLFYKTSDIKADEEHQCGYTAAQEQEEKLLQALKSDPAAQRSFGGQCIQIDLAIASDFEMFTTYGSTAATEAFIVGVINDMETDYQNVFQEDVDFTIVEQFVSTSASSSLETALTDTTRASVLLENFSTWAQGASGFTNSFDLSQIWVERDIVGSSAAAVGVASTPGVCTQNSRVAIFENFTTTAWQLRVLASHETGHNFGITHDASGSGFIMAPTINNTTSWSTQSTTEFEARVSNAACLNGTYELTGSPKAIFNAPNQVCLNQAVDFVNLSGRNPGPYTWTFTNATPTSSSATSPSATFTSAGTQTASLATSNSTCGSSVTDTEVQSIAVIAQNPPTVASCTPSSTNTATTANYLIGVQRFQVATINHLTGDAGQSGVSYSDYTCEEFASTASFSLPIQIDINTFQTQTVEVYVDINNDGVFASTEEYFSQTQTSSGVSSVDTLSGTLTIPTSVVRNQIVRVRVLAVATSNAGAVNGCTNFSFQEVEDYGLIFTAPLPVDVINFSAAEEGESIELSWEVANEVNVDLYQLEHRTDLQDWESIAKVFANGADSYGYVHQDAVRGTNYYRLTSIDKDGSFKTVRPIAIRLSGRSEQISLAPNPAQAGISVVRVAGYPARSRIEMEVFDVNGRLVQQQASHADTEGSCQFSIDLRTNVKGLYLIRVKANGVLRTELLHY